MYTSLVSSEFVMDKTEGGRREGVGLVVSRGWKWLEWIKSGRW